MKTCLFAFRSTCLACLLILVAVLSDVLAQQNPALANIVEISVPSSDAAVFNALLHAFRTTSREKNAYYGNLGDDWQRLSRKGERPALIDTTKYALARSDKPKWDTEAQEEAKRHFEGEPHAPALCFRNTWERNEQPVVLTHYQPTENVKMISKSTADAVQKTHYAAPLFSQETMREYLLFRFSLPGYDEHKQRALVYLDILDGSPHGGGVGWAFLSKVAGKWQLTWCFLAYRG